MEKDTIIFDLDGTLLNTLEGLYASFNYALKEFGYKERSMDEIRSFVGNGVVKAIERALPEKVSEKEMNSITGLFKIHYQSNMFELTKPYNGIIPMLTELKTRGYKTAVVSNKYDEAVKSLCKKYFGGLIESVAGEGAGVRKKPEIDGIIKVIKELNSSIEKSVYAGDSDVDILTAKNAGVPCISVLWGFRDKEFIERHGGKVFAEKPEDIIKIIEKKLYLG